MWCYSRGFPVVSGFQHTLRGAFMVVQQLCCFLDMKLLPLCILPKKKAPLSAPFSMCSIQQCHVADTEPAPPCFLLCFQAKLGRSHGASLVHDWVLCVSVTPIHGQALRFSFRTANVLHQDTTVSLKVSRLHCPVLKAV